MVYSRQVAEHFEQMYKDVLGILKAEKFAAGFFYGITFKVSSCNKPFPEFLMNRD